MGIERRDENSLSPKQRKSSSSKSDDQQLRLFVSEHPDVYLQEIVEKFGTTLQSGCYACKKPKISLKKKTPLLQGDR